MQVPIRPVQAFVLFFVAACGAGDDYGKLDAASAVPVRLLIIVDGSANMVEENTAIGFAMSDLTRSLSGATADWGVGITTSGTLSDGSSPGALVGPMVWVDDGDPIGRLMNQYFCTASVWPASKVPSDPSYVCGDSPGEVVTGEYLDCLCGPGNWHEDESSGEEEVLEVGFQAFCQAVSPVSSECVSDYSSINAELLTDDGVSLVLLISDQGDNSDRIEQGRSTVEPFPSLLADLGDIRWSTLGPEVDPETGGVICQDAVPTWSVERLITIAEVTGGEYAAITQGATGACTMVEPDLVFSKLIQSAD